MIFKILKNKLVKRKIKERIILGSKYYNDDLSSKLTLFNLYESTQINKENFIKDSDLMYFIRDDFLGEAVLIGNQLVNRSRSMDITKKIYFLKIKIKNASYHESGIHLDEFHFPKMKELCNYIESDSFKNKNIELKIEYISNYIVSDF
tara:strand:- start:134 stop:577 length:444 start_codon:yes stop_codon:yes gene_type:complete